MGIFEAVLLGAVQGITEFLPVSSSGHLVLLQKILGISEPALFFDTMVHVGTLIAVFVVLWKDIWRLLQRPIQRLTGFLILSTIPTVIIALAFKDTIETAFQSGAFLGYAYLFTTAALLVSEALARRPGFSGNIDRGEERMNWIDALVIGLCQGVAILPAVSRSGLTLSGALSRKLERDFAARFSFLLSIPAILGALLFQVKDLLGARKAGEMENHIADLSGEGGLTAIIAGTFTAALVGFFAVRFMLTIVRKHSLRGFAVYTGVLGILILLDQFVSHIFF
ncbi:MAG: undecaprenyl-diphosphate phosphatase [Treponema sp.]|jgi:undecaprenyl-diphosphatase|nr:undecaprenyl-diphosphate phosphatase [Treponema sp.]